MSSPQSDQFNSERMILLKEISLNPDYDIYALVDRLSINRPTLEQYMKSFFKTVAQFTDSNDELDKKYYQDVQSIINHGVQTEFGLLNDRDIDNLYYVYQKYRKIDPSLYNEADQVRANRVFEQPSNVAVAHNSSSPIPNVSGEYEVGPTTQPQSNNVPAGAPPNFNVDRLNRGYNYDFLATLSRVGLMRHVLEHLPHGPSTPAIENWIPIFELNQDDLMATPDILRLNLVKHFGDRTGDNAATAFNSYIGFLKPTEYYGAKKITGGRLNDGLFPNSQPFNFGGPQYDTTGTGRTIPQSYNPNPNVFGTPQQQGPQFVDPYNTYYHAEGVLPFGMDIRTMDAKKLIHDWEVEKKRKKRQADDLDDMMTQANRKMQMQMANMFDNNKVQGQNGMGADFMQNLMMMSMISMVTSGRASVLPYTDENGKMQLKVENNQNQLADGAHMPDPNAFGLKDIVGLFERMNDKVSEKASEAMTARVDMMEKYFGIEKKDPVQVVGETVKALKEVIPGFEERFSGGGNGQVDPLEHARILLERDKFNFDKERTDKLIDHKYELERQREEYDRDDAVEANKTRRQTMKLMSNSVVAVLPTIIQLVVMLMARRNPDLANVAGAMSGGGGGGGLGGLGGLIGNVMKLLGGAGAGAGAGGGRDDEDEDEDESDEDEGGGVGLGDVLGGLLGGGNKNQNDDSEEKSPDLTQLMNNAMNLVGNMTNNRQQSRRQQRSQYENEDEGEGEDETMPRQQYMNGSGVRPTFTQVAYGNPNSEVVPAADDIYSAIERENEKRVPITESTQEQRVPGLTDVVESVHRASKDVTEKPSIISLPRYQEKFGVKSDKAVETMVSPPQQLSQEEGGVVIPSPRSQIITPPSTQQQQQPQQEQDDMFTIPEEEEEDDYSIYTTEDFDDFTDAELRDAFNKGKASIESDESYLTSISEQLKKRVKKKR
jgi:hypothetical protein